MVKFCADIVYHKKGVFMKRIVVIFFLLILNVNINALDSIIQIEQNGQINNGSGNHFVIDDNKFNIIISNTNGEPIHIFVYHNNQMFLKYQYPISCENTVMFHPASVLIRHRERPNANEKIPLWVF